MLDNSSKQVNKIYNMDLFVFLTFNKELLHIIS